MGKRLKRICVETIKYMMKNGLISNEEIKADPEMSGLVESTLIKCMHDDIIARIYGGMSNDITELYDKWYTRDVENGLYNMYNNDWNCYLLEMEHFACDIMDIDVEISDLESDCNLEEHYQLWKMERYFDWVDMHHDLEFVAARHGLSVSDVYRNYMN